MVRLTLSVSFVIMIFIHIIKFESAPSRAEEHALFRSVASAYAYSYLVQILSLSLIAFGVSYKVLLKIEYTEAKHDTASRFLAEAPKVTPETAATLFSGGLTATLIALELLTLTVSNSKFTLLCVHSRTISYRFPQNSMVDLRRLGGTCMNRQETVSLSTGLLF